jgi:para-nitrobenzyl esterase
LFGKKAAEFLQTPESRKTLPGQGYAPVSGIDCTVKGVLSDKAAQGKGGYCYCFDPDIPGWDNPGTFHSSDLWFWFETLAKCWRPFTGRHYDLARQMCDYFCNFIRSGNPNGKDLNGEELPQWDKWSAENPCTMRFTGEGAKAEHKSQTDFGKFITARILERMNGLQAQ